MHSNGRARAPGKKDAADGDADGGGEPVGTHRTFFEPGAVGTQCLPNRGYAN